VVHSAFSLFELLCSSYIFKQAVIFKSTETIRATKTKYLNVSSNISQKKKEQANACGYMYKKSPVQSQSRRVE
jgi:hypothetical protein